MKIAFLTERIILGFGVDLVVDNVAQGLSELGHDVTVFTINVDGLHKNRKYRIKRILCPLIWNPIMQELVAHKYLPYIKNLENEFDVFIIETFPFFQYAAFLNKPTIIVEYGVPSTMGMNWKSKIRLGYEKITKNYLYYHFVDKIIPISDYLKTALPAYAKKKTEIVYVGSNHYYLDISKDQEQINEIFKKKLGIKKDEKLLLYVGRLNYKDQPYKGVDDLVEIYKSLKKKNKKVQLLMVGYGNEKDRKCLEKLGAKVITNAPQEDMPTIFSSCDVYMTASKWEGFNLSIAEANSFGKPVVCYDLGPHNEVINQNVSGFAVKDREEFIEKVLKLTHDEELYKKMSIGAFERSRKFIWKDIIKKYNKIIGEIVINSKKTKPMDYEKGLVDVITLNYNGKKYLTSLFDSLKKQTYDRFRITMVDNGSKDNSLAFVKEKHKEVNILALKENLFFPRANNLAISQTNGEYILLLNNDIIVDKNAIKEMVKTIEKDPQTAAVAAKMMFNNNRKVFDSFGTAILPDGSPFNRGIGQYDIGQYDVEEDVFGACFGAVLLKRSVYEKVVGPLDNDYFGYFEDVDWCFRANGMGFKIVTCPKAIVYHDHSGTSKFMGYEWKYFLIHRNFLRTIFKNYGLKHAIKYYFFQIRRLIKHMIYPPSAARRMSCIKILLDSFFYFPTLISKRLQVRGKRINTIIDEMIWSYSNDEKPFFDAEKYEPEYTIKNIEHSYKEKYKRLSKMIISDTSKAEVRKTLIRLNNLAYNYWVYDDKSRKDLIDLIQQDLRRDLGVESGDIYTARLRAGDIYTAKKKFYN